MKSLLLLPAFLLAFPMVVLAEKPPTDAKKLSEVAQDLEEKGYSPISEADFDDGRWEIEAYQEGKKVELKVDAKTGEILKQKAG